MFRSRRGQSIPILEIIYSLVIVGILYLMFFGSWINTVTAQGIAAGNMTGLEAFFFSNLGLWTIIGIILCVMWWTYSGGSG